MVAAAKDPNRAKLVRVAAALGALREEVVFVGGATVGLLITDPAAPSVRPTKDVDVVIELVSYTDYQTKLGPALRKAGFQECTDEGAPICAWKIDGIRVDVMPTEGEVLGFTNRWYKGAVANAEDYDLDGTAIRLITSPYFIATKLVAFEGRGEGDYYFSHDIEDILAVIDGRPEVASDVIQADEDVRDYIVNCAMGLIRSDDFASALPGHVEQGRDDVVMDRLRNIALVGHYDRHLKNTRWVAEQSDWQTRSPDAVNCVTALLNLGHHALGWDLLSGPESAAEFERPFASRIAMLPNFFRDVSNEVDGRDARPGDVYWWKPNTDGETAAHVGICAGPGDEMIHARPGGRVVMCHCEEHGADSYDPKPTAVYRWIGRLQP